MEYLYSPQENYQWFQQVIILSKVSCIIHFLPYGSSEFSLKLQYLCNNLFDFIFFAEYGILCFKLEIFMKECSFWWILCLLSYHRALTMAYCNNNKHPIRLLLSWNKVTHVLKYQTCLCLKAKLNLFFLGVILPFKKVR